MAHGPLRTVAISIHTNRAAAGIPKPASVHIIQAGGPSD